MNRTALWAVAVIASGILGWYAATAVHTGAPLADEEDAYVRFRNALTVHDSFERTELLIKLARHLGPETLPGAARAFREDHATLDPIDLRILTWAWAKQDPRGMVESVASWGDSRMPRLAATQAIGEVARTEGYVAARELFDSMPSSIRQQSIPALILAYLEGGGIDSVAGLIDSYSLGMERDTVAGIVCTQMIRVHGPERLELWVEGLPVGHGTRNEIKRVAFRAAQTAHMNEGEREALEAWLARVEDEPWTQGAWRGIAVHWVKREPEAAIAWARALPPERDRQEAIAEAVRVWAATDADAALAWLRTQEPDVTLDRGAGRLAIFYSKRREYGVSFEMLGRIVSDVTWDNTTRTLKNSWKTGLDDEREGKLLARLDTIEAARRERGEGVGEG